MDNTKIDAILKFNMDQSIASSSALGATLSLSNESKSIKTIVDLVKDLNKCNSTIFLAEQVKSIEQFIESVESLYTSISNYLNISANRTEVNKNNILNQIRDILNNIKYDIKPIINRQKILSLLEVNTNELLQEQRYGILSLKSEEAKIEYVKKLLNNLLSIDYGVVTTTQEQTIASYIDSVTTLFQEIRNHNGSENEKKKIILKIDAVIDSSSSIKALSLYDTVSAMQQNIDNKINTKVSEYTDTLFAIKKIESDAKNALQNIHLVSSKAVVSKHSVIFKEEAANHKRNSWCWFAGIIVLIVTIILIAYGLLNGSLMPSSNDIGIIIQYTIAKLIIFSTLYFALAWAVKSYRANKHNEVLNKHRQNALDTFDAFVDAASSDEQTKNAVLLQTVQSIFCQQNTGYNEKEGDYPEHTKILEIIGSSVKNNN